MNNVEVELMTAEQVAVIFRVAATSVNRWAREGRLPAVRIGQAWRFRREDIRHILMGEQ